MVVGLAVLWGNVVVIMIGFVVVIACVRLSLVEQRTQEQQKARMWSGRTSGFYTLADDCGWGAEVSVAAQDGVVIW